MAASPYPTFRYYGDTVQPNAQSNPMATPFSSLNSKAYTGAYTDREIFGNPKRFFKGADGLWYDKDAYSGPGIGPGVAFTPKDGSAIGSGGGAVYPAGGQPSGGGGGTGGASADGGGGGSPDTFNLNPAPTTQGPFGAVPGQLGLPNPYQDLARALPGLGRANAGVSRVLNDALAGRLNNDVRDQITNRRAVDATKSGMPGTNTQPGSLQHNATLRDLGLTSMDQQRWGVGAYPGIISSISSTQTVNPALKEKIASDNADKLAMPDPTQAAGYAKLLYDQYLSSMGGSGGGAKNPAGGTTSNPGNLFSNPSGGTITNPSTFTGLVNQQLPANLMPGGNGNLTNPTNGGFDPTQLGGAIQGNDALPEFSQELNDSYGLGNFGYNPSGGGGYDPYSNVYNPATDLWDESMYYP